MIDMIVRGKGTLSISIFSVPIPLLKLSTTSNRVAHSYANKSERTLIRDIDALEKTGVGHKGGRGIFGEPESDSGVFSRPI